MKELLKDLMMAYSPSGYEKPATDILKKYFGEINLLGPIPVYEDKIGNAAWCLGSGPIKVLLSAHIDEVNARVSNISEDGIISVINTGGMCKKSLIASEIVILNKNNEPVVGVVEKKAIHCEKDEERNKVGDIYDMKINIGAESKEEVMKKFGIYPGAFVVYQRRCFPEFGNHQICGTGLDDKVGIYIVAEIMKNLSNLAGHGGWADKYTVMGLSATQEETGCRGAQIAAHELNPDISIDFDVTFSTDGNIGIPKAQYGDVVLGKGGVIEFGPDKSMRIANLLIESCEKWEIPYQTAPSRCGGTNTNQIQLRSRDCETMLVSIPNRSMHTPVEVCDWRDIDSIINMIVTLITSENL